ncbi:MAG: aminoacyl-tRNA hydrolase [Verrucomicrobiota bacterium]|nr:aminoacyl-tRNA hydrolase [Verrucomicrobiota bacterium]
MKIIPFKLVVGLGNPGSKYEDTRHNIGFKAVDRFIASFKTKLIKDKKYNSEFYKGRLKGNNFFIQKPLTFMNLSGQAVSAICKKNDILPSEIIVIYDCLDLPLGMLRLKPKGGSGGHNGMSSIIDELQTQNFARLRLGISSPEQNADVADFVLSQFDAEEKKIAEEVVNLSPDIIISAIYRGINYTMNKYNNTTLPLERQEKSV